MVKDLDALAMYPRSGHAVILGNLRLTGQVVREVLERFGNSGLKSKAAYAAFVADGLG
jgi:hypothetical protein